MKLDAERYAILTGQSAYDLDIPAHCEVELDLRGDADFRVYGVSSEVVVPLYRGDHFRFRGRLRGFTSIQVCCQMKSDLVAYDAQFAEIRDGQKIGSERLVVKLSDVGQDETLARAVQMMVREQLRRSGFDPDMDERQFGDGNMEFEDDEDDYGDSPYLDPDPEFVRSDRVSGDGPSKPASGSPKQDDGSDTADSGSEADPES